jgi:predicted ester cyclase
MSATESTTRGVAETARSYFDAISRQDLDAMVAHWKPGASGSIHGMVELTASDNYREWFGTMFAAFPDLEFEVLDLIAEGDHAAVRWRATGTFTGGEFEGMVPNGSAVEMEGCDMVTVRDGLIVDNRAYMNAAEMGRQLGVMPAQGSPGERAMLGAMNLKTRLRDLLRR